MSTITAFIPVYNEENRISYAIESFLWCDEIIVLDKNSNDQTVDIAKSYGEKVTVIITENKSSYSTSDWEWLISKTKTEWVIRVTASDVFHPELAKIVLNKIRDKEFTFDTIYVPFNRYVLGINHSRSPWFSEVCPMIFRTNTLKINPTSVHHSLIYNNNFLL